MSPINKVALIGANGNLGPHILSALLAAKFTVTVLSRKSSTSKYPDSVTVRHISDDATELELERVLAGQDALISSFMGSNSALQIKLANAAANAGVRRFMPADFGSCDSSSPRALELMPLYVHKQKVREHLQGLAKRIASFSWTSLVCGHFFDYGLKSGLLHFDLKARKARVFDGGDVRWSATVLPTIGTAVVKILQMEEQTRNRMLYMQSFCVTQNEVLKSLEQVTGKSWEVEHVNSDEYIKEVKAQLDADSSNHEASENMVGVVGIVDANWEGKDDFAIKLLGLENEDMHEAVKKAVSS